MSRVTRIALPGRPRLVIVGAGFAGIGMAMRLKAAGHDDFLVLERAERPGGTWWANRYPGAACDIESLLYSYSFRPKADWSRDYGSQAEILAYLDDCIAAAGLAPHLRCGCAVASARFDRERAGWQLELANGESLDCQLLVVATGPLSTPAFPELPGRDRFAGAALHSADWPQDIDLRGRRIAVIGTGASAIQLVPRLAPLAAALSVFQRNPPWILPKSDHPAPAWRERLFRRLPALQSLARAAIWCRHELAAVAVVRHPRLMQLARAAALRQLRRQVPDAALRQRLVPSYTMGCKRILLSNDYLPALCLPQVRLVTAPIQAVEAAGLRTADGELHACDTLVYATGFATGNRHPPIQACGRNGVQLSERWSARPQAYLGTAMHGFPNLFLLLGPNTGLGHNSMITMIEAQLGLVLRCLDELARRGARVVEVDAAAEADYNRELQRRLAGTVWSSGCRSWYLDEDGGNSTMWPDFTWRFAARTRRFEPSHWRFEA